MDGYVQLHFDLGSGRRVLEVRSRSVNDAESHSLVVTRTEDTVQLLLDDRYLNRTSGAGGGEANVTLEISLDHVFLGGQVDVSGEERELVEGFRGCITGISLDRKDLPFTTAGNRDFRIISAASDDDIIAGCPFLVLTESTPPGVYIYAGIGAILGGVLLTSVIFVLVCGVGGYCWRSRRGTARSRTGSPSHGQEFSWQPARQLSRKPPPEIVSLGYLKTDVSPSDPDGRETAESTFTATQNQNGNRHRSQSPPFQTRPASGRRQHVAEPVEGFTAMSQANPGYLQDSPVVSGGEREDTRPANRFVQHMRSLSGCQSIRSTGSGKSNVTYIPREVLDMDDEEVTKYIRKKVEAADLENEEHDVDAMEHFKEEGPFEPLGSIGSLYDFVRNLDSPTHFTSEGGQAQTQAPPTASVGAESRMSPTGEHPSSNAAAPLAQSSRPPVGPKPLIPVKPPTTPTKPSSNAPTSPSRAPVSPTKPPTSPTKPRSPTGLGKRPVVVQSYSLCSPTKSPPPAAPLTRTHTSPSKPPPISPAPPGYESKPALPVLTSPPPSHSQEDPSTHVLSPSDPAEQNRWVPVHQRSASQPDNVQRMVKTTDPTKLRRSGRRSHRVTNQNRSVGNMTGRSGHLETSGTVL